MHILIYSYFEPQANLVSGGAQRIAGMLLRGFLDAGHHIDYICPPLRDTQILQHERLQIYPYLHHFDSRRPFLHEQLLDWQLFQDLADKCDVIWSVDFSIPVRVNKPTLLTIDTLAYTNEISAVFAMCWDALVVSSPYLLRCLQPIFGEHAWIGRAPELSVISYAVDTQNFRPVPSSNLRIRLQIPPQAKLILLPHRPDPTKGFDLALQVIQRLIEHDPSFRLLIPQNERYGTDRRFYNSIRSQASLYGIDEYVILHEWLTTDDLPEYFSDAYITLVPGTFPEGFGLVPLESISCGTPVIATNLGAVADLLPDGYGLERVEAGNVDSIVTHILHPPTMAQVKDGQQYIRDHYAPSLMINSYIQRLNSLQRCDAIYNSTRVPLQISPWCRWEEAEIWLDHRHRAYTLTRNEIAVMQMVEQMQFSDLSQHQQVVERLLEKGILVGRFGEFDTLD